MGREICTSCGFDFDGLDCFEVQVCTNCGKPVLPCSKCLLDSCLNCPFDD